MTLQATKRGHSIGNLGDEWLVVKIRDVSKDEVGVKTHHYNRENRS